MRERLAAHNPCEVGKDYEGNTYKVIRIGKQCWMAENLHTTHDCNGNLIPLHNDGTAKAAPFMSVPNNMSCNVPEYDYLYNL